jgi:serine protease AprX
MAIEIPRGLVEEVLLGPPDDRRLLQDSPILADVWIAFAREPDRQLDLLITPHRETVAGVVATTLRARIKHSRHDPGIAFLQGIVAATLAFDDLLRVVVPMTEWWQSPRVQSELKLYVEHEHGPEKLNHTINAILTTAKKWGSKSSTRERDRLSALERYVALAGLLLWAGTVRSRKRTKSLATPTTPFAEAIGSVKVQTIADLLDTLFDAIVEERQNEKLVFQVSLNRTASSAVLRSVPAVKADAARTLFSVRCDEITWAVIDSGIDSTHPAFNDASGRSRVRKSFDFTQIRRIVSLSNTNPGIRRKNIEELRKTRQALPSDADKILRELADDASKGDRINWPLAEQIVSLPSAETPLSDHGTHVAGIIGASRNALLAAQVPDDECVDGMCPEINLFDFRVLAPTLSDTEFAVIAALQYIRHLNERHSFITIHGANLSLSIPHDVRNYACGLTPVCSECEQMVNSGIVVVAAAGNRGYQSFETKEGSYEGYAALSLTDPGNADGVITVGSTHRYSPHTYGVSFFSSRGPTGDGRPKPDLVAPGERIRGPFPGGQWGDLDGTSMAAPHVSGAAAMLMARYSELIGQPRRIKEILCGSATDLGRERNFQGRGMLDVLRAFQSV